MFWQLVVSLALVHAFYGMSTIAIQMPDYNKLWSRVFFTSEWEKKIRTSINTRSVGRSEETEHVCFLSQLPTFCFKNFHKLNVLFIQRQLKPVDLRFYYPCSTCCQKRRVTSVVVCGNVSHHDCSKLCPVLENPSGGSTVWLEHGSKCYLKVKDDVSPPPSSWCKVSNKRLKTFTRPVSLLQHHSRRRCLFPACIWIMVRLWRPMSKFR